MITHRTTARATLALAFALPFVGAAPEARAGSMDFALERLVSDAGCRSPAGAAIPVDGGGFEQCVPDQAAFTNLVNQYALAIAPSAMYPARTTGYGGFEIQFQANYTGIDSSADYFRRGTRGATDGVTGLNARENGGVPSFLQLYSLRLRKGFGFGFEVGSEFGVLGDTNIIAGGIDLRLALLEGFRDSVPGYLPDFAVAGSVRTITGTPQVQLTVVGVSGVLSKPITIASSGQLTPMVGFQYLWLFGDSGVVDFTPATDPQQACGFQGPDQPGTPGASLGDGGPVCSGGGVTDFNNNAVFDPVRLNRQRLFFGANYRYEILTFGAQMSVDVIPPERGQNTETERRALTGAPSQTQFTLQVGAAF